MAEAIKKGFTTAGIEDKTKRFKRRLNFAPREVVTWLFIPNWVIYYLKFRQRAYINRSKRYGENVVFFLSVMSAFFVLFISISTHPLLFLPAWILIHTVMNPLPATEVKHGNAKEILLVPGISSRWFAPNPEYFFYGRARIPLSYAPDANSSSYPLGWSPEVGWIRHGYRTFGMRPEIFPRHLVVFGEHGYGQNGMALNCTMRAFEILKNVVVLVLDVDSGGLNFRALKDMNGIYIVDTQVECERTIWYIAQIIKQRKGTLKPGTNFLIVADKSFAESLIGRNSETNHIAGAINEIVIEGRNFGVNIVAFPPAKYFYQRIAEDYQHEYDRVQFFTKAKYKIKQAGAGTMVEKNVESPRAGIDYFLFDVNGKAVEFKACAPTMEQVINRIIATRLPDEAIQWWRDFSLGNNFKEFAPLPRRDETGMGTGKKQAQMFKRFIKWQERRKAKGRLHIGVPKHEHIPQPNDGAADAGERRYE